MKKAKLSLTVFITTILICVFTTFAERDDIKPEQIQHRLHASNKKVSKQKPIKKRKNIDDMLQEAADSDQSVFYLLLLAFIAGILTSLTPCVYPMIPITVGILQTQQTKSLYQSLLAAATYVLGISVVYASLGYIAATSSLIFGQWISSPWVVGFIVLFFLYLAFSMFDFYEIYTPAFLQKQRGEEKPDSLLKIFIFGLISGSVASPCLTPALAVLLAIVAKQGNPIIGFLTLFLFSIGMGILLIVVGTFSRSLAMLPRAGAWMEHIKSLMGFALIATSVYFLQTFITQAVANILYAAIAAVALVYFFLKTR